MTRSPHSPHEVAPEHSAAPDEAPDVLGSGEKIWEQDPEAYSGPERVLLDHGVITLEQLQRAMQAARKDHPRLSVMEALVQDGAIDEVQALQAVAIDQKLPFARINPAEIDSKAFALLPVPYMKANRIVPLGRDETGVYLAVADPTEVFIQNQDDIKRRIPGEVNYVVALPAEILNAIEELSADPTEQVDKIIQDIAEDTVEVVDNEADEVADLEMLAGESPVIRYVNFLISSAVREEASDIHIEPGEGRLRVRCRIDGVLFEQQAPPAKMHAAIISRLKIMANLDIAERRLPQDGRIRATVHGRTVDLRVSTLPIIHGEKCVIRILDNRSTMVGLENLGFQPDILEQFRKQILQPHGIVLVTGPTGSGKSTTLYSSLRIMDGDRLNISTVEDPVEYELDFCNQVNVHERIGMTFSAALRSLLRQDPDVIMLGEIRDEETARIAIQASLTGHMVLSTLHTNDAPSSITRLSNIGIESFLISAALNGILAQRLVRRICTHCRRPAESVEESILKYLEKYGGDTSTLYEGAGCDKCRQTGFKGRIGIYEFLVVNEELRDLITRNPTLNELRAAAAQSGMRSLRQDGLLKVADGLTTGGELMRVTEV